MHTRLKTSSAATELGSSLISLYHELYSLNVGIHWKMRIYIMSSFVQRHCELSSTQTWRCTLSHMWCGTAVVLDLVSIDRLGSYVWIQPMHAAGQTWLMYVCVSVCACVYVGLHVNACNPICMYFTHAHINLLFIKNVIRFIFLLSSSDSPSCSISQKCVFFSRTVARLHWCKAN